MHCTIMNKHRYRNGNVIEQNYKYMYPSADKIRHRKMHITDDSIFLVQCATIGNIIVDRERCKNKTYHQP